MPPGERVQVTIRGRTYWLVGDDPEHTRALAKKVDETITRIADVMGPGADNFQLAILTALQIADELAAVRAEHERCGEGTDGFAARLLASIEDRLDASDPASESL